MIWRLLFLLLFLQGPARAETIRLALDTLEPWKMIDTKGQAVGAYVDIARELAKRSNASLQIIECPLKRCLLMLQNGEADMAIGLKASSARDVFIRFMKTPYRLHASDKVFYMRAGTESRLKDAHDLAALAIGVKLGSELDNTLSADKRLNVQSVTDPRVNFQKLAIGRIDAVAIAEDQGEFLVATMHQSAMFAKAPYREPDVTPRSIAIARNSPLAAKLPQLETIMRGMREDGTLRRIFREQYFERFGIKEGAVSVE